MTINHNLRGWALLAVIGLLSPLRAADEAPPPDYDRQIAPIFHAYCNGCHGADDPEGGLDLSEFAALLRGGDGGVAISPGQSDQSRLLLMIEGRVQPVMPPEGNEPPSADEIALLKRWIDAGAPGPRGQRPDPTQLVTPRVELLAPARRVVTAAGIAPDGKTLALGGYTEVRLLAAADRTPLRTITGIRGTVTDLAFSQDGKRLLTAAGEPGLFGEAQLWDVATGKLQRTFTGHRDSLYAAALSPDGKLLATGSYDQQIKIWDVAQGTELRGLAGHNGAVFSLAFSPNGQVLASASADRTVKLWNPATGARLDTLAEPLLEVYSVVFRPDGKQVLAGGADSRIRVWNLSPTAAEGTNKLVLSRFAHEGAILKLAFSRDGQTLVSSGEDHSVKVWNARGYVERHLLAGQTDLSPALALGAAELLIGRLDGSYALYNATDGKEIPPPAPELAAAMPRGGQRGSVVALRLSGKHLASVTAAELRGPDNKPVKLKLTGLPTSADSHNAAELTLHLPDALARGTYQLAISTAAGRSNLLPWHIDDLPQWQETEPNDTAEKAALVSLPVSAWGVLASAGDEDHYRFEAAAGQTIVCELTANRIGSALNGVLTVLDPRGQVVASNNDFGGNMDSLVAYRVPAAGTYAVRVSDLARTGSAKHFYRLSIGELPYVTGAFPLNVSAQRESTVWLSGYNLPPDAQVRVAPDAAGMFDLPLDTRQYRWAGPVRVLATTQDERLEVEPNDQPAQATPLPAPGSIHGRIHAAGGGTDVDLYRFEARTGETWIIETEAARRGSPIDTRIEVLHEDGRPVERLLLQAVRDSYLTFRSIDSNGNDARVKNWEEMELNEWMYLQGEVCKILRMPQGPDSGFNFYTSAGKRRCYFDTSATAHAVDEPCYIVEPHPPGTTLIPTGLPVFTLYYANDDDGQRKLGADSRLTFTAPQDGAYLVRVTDVQGFSSDRHVYRLAIRRPEPDFQVRLTTPGVTVAADSGSPLNFTVDRIDNFDDDITIEVAGLPAGFAIAGPLTIQAGHDAMRAVLTAAADASAPADNAWKQVRFVAHAQINGSRREQAINPLAAVKLEPRPEVVVRMSPAEITIAPGEMVSATLTIERNGFDGRVAFDVSNLPHGVIVDNIGLNGILIPEGKSQRQLFLKASPWVPETDRPIFAETKAIRGANALGNQASPAVMLRVRHPSTVAQSEGQD